MEEKVIKIKCPYCGCEYLPCELFLPNDFLGKSDNIIKDVFGKIIYSDYKINNEPNLKEQYICDTCENKFKIEANITYKTEKMTTELDFKNQSVSLID